MRAATLLDTIPTAVKGLNTYWLRESAKLCYDSFGLALDGQTVEIALGLGGAFDTLEAITIGDRGDGRPSNHILLTLAMSIPFVRLNATDSNGNTNTASTSIADLNYYYLDRTIAHEMVHVAMFANGTEKAALPQFIGDSAQAETFSYDTNNAVVTNYDEDDTIIYTKPLNQAISFLSPDDLEIAAVKNDDFYQTQTLILQKIFSDMKLMTDFSAGTIPLTTLKAKT